MPATVKTRTLNLETLKLLSGSHSDPEKGLCVMEAVAFMAGESHGDHPQCASPVISAFLRRWNDRVTDEERQELKRYIAPLIGSRVSLAVERKRAWLAADWAVRVAAPAYLRNAKLAEHADKLAALPEIKDRATWKKVESAAAAAYAAADAAYAAYAAADAADAAAAYAAANAAANAAAYAAAYANAANAAYAAADAAYAAADANAANAAYAAADADAAADAAYAAADAAKKIRAGLTASAHDLVERMLAVKE